MSYIIIGMISSVILIGTLNTNLRSIPLAMDLVHEYTVKRLQGRGLILWRKPSNILGVYYSKPV